MTLGPLGPAAVASVLRSRARALFVEPEQADVEREPYELRSGVAVELLVDVGSMRFDRSKTRAGESGDLGIGMAEREEP